MPKFGLSAPLGGFKFGPKRAPWNYSTSKRPKGMTTFVRKYGGTAWRNKAASKIQALLRGRHARLKYPMGLFKKYRNHPLVGRPRFKYGSGYGVNSFRYQR